MKNDAFIKFILFNINKIILLIYKAMRYDKSKNGYFYKVYKNGKKTRVSKNEYETKGGGNNQNNSNNRKKSINALRKFGKDIAYTEGLKNNLTFTKPYDKRMNAINKNTRRGVEELSIPTERYGYYAPGTVYDSGSASSFLNSTMYKARNFGRENSRKNNKFYGKEYGYNNLSGNIELKTQVAKETASKARNKAYEARNKAYEAFRGKIQRGNIYS